MEDEVCPFVIPGQLVLTTSSILSLLLFITVVDAFTKNKTDGLSSKFFYVICSLQATKVKTSLASRDTHKESQNSLITLLPILILKFRTRKWSPVI